MDGSHLPAGILSSSLSDGHHYTLVIRSSYRYQLTLTNGDRGLHMMVQILYAPAGRPPSIARLETPLASWKLSPLKNANCCGLRTWVEVVEVISWMTTWACPTIRLNMSGWILYIEEAYLPGTIELLRGGIVIELSVGK